MTRSTGGSLWPVALAVVGIVAYGWYAKSETREREPSGERELHRYVAEFTPGEGDAPTAAVQAAGLLPSQVASWATVGFRDDRGVRKPDVQPGVAMEDDELLPWSTRTAWVKSKMYLFVPVGYEKPPKELTVGIVLNNLPIGRGKMPSLPPAKRAIDPKEVRPSKLFESVTVTDGRLIAKLRQPSRGRVMRVLRTSFGEPASDWASEVGGRYTFLLDHPRSLQEVELEVSEVHGTGYIGTFQLDRLVAVEVNGVPTLQAPSRSDFELGPDTTLVIQTLKADAPKQPTGGPTTNLSLSAKLLRTSVNSKEEIQSVSLRVSSPELLQAGWSIQLIGTRPLEPVNMPLAPEGVRPAVTSGPLPPVKLDMAVQMGVLTNPIREVVKVENLPRPVRLRRKAGAVPVHGGR